MLQHVEEDAEEDGGEDDEDVGAPGAALLGRVLAEQRTRLGAERCLQSGRGGAAGVRTAEQGDSWKRRFAARIQDLP